MPSFQGHSLFRSPLLLLPSNIYLLALFRCVYIIKYCPFLHLWDVRLTHFLRFSISEVMAAQSSNSAKEGSSSRSISSNGLSKNLIVGGTTANSTVTTLQTPVTASSPPPQSVGTTNKNSPVADNTGAGAPASSGVEEDEEEPRNGPYIDKAVSKNVTALLGKTAYLNCRVKNVGNKTVSDFTAVQLNFLIAKILICKSVAPITIEMELRK